MNEGNVSQFSIFFSNGLPRGVASIQNKVNDFSPYEINHINKQLYFIIIIKSQNNYFKDYHLSVTMSLLDAKSKEHFLFSFASVSLKNNNGEDIFWVETFFNNVSVPKAPTPRLSPTVTCDGYVYV